MADTYTTNLNLTKPEPGAAEDTWGISLNADLDSLDAIFSSSGTQINLNPNQINFADNKKAIFGTGSDLEIYHDGSNSWIKDTGTGDLVVRSSTNIFLQDATGANNYAKFTTNAVELRHNNDVRFTTTSTGIDVTGIVTADGLTVEQATSPTITINDTDSLLPLTIKQDGANASMLLGSAGVLTLGVTNNSGLDTVILQTQSKSRLNIASGGDISFYDDTGTSENLKWDASADSLDFVDGAMARFGAGNDFQVEHDGLDTTLKNYTGSLYLQNLADDKDVFIKSDNGSGGTANYFQADGSTGETKLFHYGSEKISTTSSGISVTGTVTSDGLTVDGVARAGSGGVVLTGQYSSSYPNPSANGYFQLKTNNQDANRGGITIARSSDTSGTMLDALRINYLGDISFYDDTGSTQGFFWDASAERLGINTTAPTELLHIYNTGGAGNDANVLIEGNGSGVNAKLTIDGHASGGQLDLTYRSDTQSKTVAMKCLNDGSFRIDTLGSEAMRIVGDNVGIGTDSPSSILEVRGDGGNNKQLRLSTGATTYWDLGRSSANGNFEITEDSGDTYFTIDKTSGNVGIGTDSPSLTYGGKGLNIENNDTAGITINDTTGAKLDLAARSSDVLIYGIGGYAVRFGQDATERMRLDSSGNLLVGKSSSSLGTAGHEIFHNGVQWLTASNSRPLLLNRLSTDGTIAEFRKDGTTVGSIGTAFAVPYLANSSNFGIRVDDANNGELLPVNTSGSGVDATADLGRSNIRWKDLHLSGTGYFGTSVGIGTDSPEEKMQLLSSGNTLIRVTSGTSSIAGIDFGDTDDTDVGRIRYLNSSNALQFSTQATERMRLDSSGNLLVGKTASGLSTDGAELAQGGTAGKVQITRTSNAPLLLNRRSTDGTILDFRKDGTTVGSISVTSSATTYNTSSDARLKDVTGEARGLEVITKLNPVAYNWKADGKADEGLIAQEVKELVPNAVTGSEDEHYQMDYSKLVTHLVKGMKEQQEQIEFLKEEIANLKGE